jgi:hypothetical protein
MGQSDGGVLPNRSPAGLRRYGLALVVYIFATWFTAPHFMGDTLNHAFSVLGLKFPFWEFGHLLWRPAGWVFSRILEPLMSLTVGSDVRVNVLVTLLGLSWLAGLATVFLLCELTSLFCRKEWVINVAAIALIFSQGFLNYFQTGSSYVPGLALLSLGLYILARDGDKPERSLRTGLLAGSALAGAVCFWLLYVLALPAALAAPLFWFGVGRYRLRLVAQTTFACALVGALVYAVAALSLGSYSVEGLKAWIASSSHGITELSGVARTVFGIPFSFLYMGDDNVIFKRYLADDPFNPVSPLALFRASLVKIIFLYIFLMSIALNLLRSQRGRRMLGLLVLNSIPVIAFAVYWQGSAMERYFPVYPLLFLSLAYSLESDRSSRKLNLVALAFVAFMVVINVSSLSQAAMDRREERIVARLKELEPLLKPESLIVIAPSDQLVDFYWSYPFNPINNYGGLRLYMLVELGTMQAPRWRQDFASRALSAWEKDADVWVSRRVCSPRPRAEWNWVEGGDRRILWEGFYTFFSRLETGVSAGGEDGFTLLSPSPKNEQFLNEAAREEHQTETE